MNEVLKKQSIPAAMNGVYWQKNKKIKNKENKKYIYIFVDIIFTIHSGKKKIKPVFRYVEYFFDNH